jgi:hypothetical protein
MARYCRADVHILVLNHFRRSGPQRRQVNNQNPTRSSIVFTSAFGPEALPHCILSGHGVLLAELSAFTPQICQRLGLDLSDREAQPPGQLRAGQRPGRAQDADAQAHYTFTRQLLARW